MDDREYVRHDDLSCTAAEVSPPGRDGVGGANNCCGEHGAHPELGGDEGGQREADEEADDEEAGGGVDNGETVNRRRNEEEEGGGGEPGPEHVAGGTHHNSGEDGAGDGGYSGVADFGGREVEVVADDGEEGRGCEGGDETAEVGNPGDVECPHVWLRHCEEAEYGGFVFGVHRKREIWTVRIGMIRVRHFCVFYFLEVKRIKTRRIEICEKEERLGFKLLKPSLNPS